jgi:hypothetical protein
VARQYKRKSNGQFGSGSTTVKQDRPGHQAVKDRQKKKLNIKTSAGKHGRKKLATKAKVKGKVLRTKQAKNTASRSRKRFG